MTIGIIGLGRFGTLLTDILSEKYHVIGFDRDEPLEPLNRCDTVFICVPIRDFEHVIKQIAPHLKPQATVIDTCSVKCHPVKVMQAYLPCSITQIATHPLFGPDSYSKGVAHRVMMYFIQGDENIYQQWAAAFQTLGLTIIKITPEQHDQAAAYSQGITHCLGRILKQMQIKPTPIDTLGFERLLGIKDQTCNDTSTLFEDLMRYNPYSRQMIDMLKQNVSLLADKLDNGTYTNHCNNESKS